MSFSRRLAAFAALSIGFLWFSSPPAAAHTGFESSDPVDGSVVASHLDQIVLRFSGQAEPAGEGFVVLDPSGVLRAPDTVIAREDNLVWTLGFNPPLTGGAVGVRWTVQAPDAHPIEGSFSFTVDALAPPVEPAEPSADELDQAPAADQTQPAPDRAVATDPPADRQPTETGQEPDEEGLAAASTSVEQQDLDSFLSESEVATPYAKGLGAFGRFLGFIGTMLGIGGIVFAGAVLHDHRRDTLAVLKLVRYSAVLVLVGTVIDLIAHLAVAAEGWSSKMWSTSAIESTAISSYGVAIGLRSASALMLLTATAATARAIGKSAAPMVSTGRTLALAGVGASRSGDVYSHAAERPGSAPDVGPLTYSRPQGSSSNDMPITVAMVSTIVTLLVSFTFDGHTVSEGNRWITGAVDMVHVVAGAVWAGGVLAFAIVLWRRHQRGARLDALELGVRFSVVAGAALAAAGVAGTALAVIILDNVSELWSTPWGLLLIGKFIAVVAAAGLGSFNHFVVIPWLEADPADDSRSILLRNTATGEALLLCVVLTVTAFLVGAAS